MASTFQLRVVTPKRQMLDEPVREVTAPGTAGEFGVLPEHVSFLGSLEIGLFRYKSEKGDRRLAVRGGFAEVASDVMTVLADDAAFPEDVDAEAARREASEAEAKLKSLSPLDADYATLDATRRWAEAKLALAGRS